MKHFFGYFDPEIVFFKMMKINNFRGDLNNISAKTALIAGGTVLLYDRELLMNLAGDGKCQSIRNDGHSYKKRPGCRKVVESHSTITVCTSIRVDSPSTGLAPEVLFDRDTCKQGHFRQCVRAMTMQ